MTRDDIIRMALEVGLLDRRDDTNDGAIAGFVGTLMDFANLVAAVEREACAEACINQEWRAASDVTVMAEKYAASVCAEAIRARGDK